MTTTQGIVLTIISSVLILSYAESLYSRACAKGDASVECQKFCELCQTGCIPPGKTLATKTFMDVCNENQQLEFDQEKKEYTKICEEYMDGLAFRATSEKEQATNINTKASNQEHNFNETTAYASKSTFAFSLLLAIICGLLAYIAKTNRNKKVAEQNTQTREKEEPQTITNYDASLPTKMLRQVVQPDKNVHNCRGIKASGSFLFVDGCIGLAPDGRLVAGGVVDQAKQALENMKTVLEAGSSSFQEVVKVTIFLLNVEDFDSVKDLYATYFPSEPPALSIVAVAGLPHKALFQIECIALTDSNL